MSKKRPVRVLHIIDTLGGGGSERLVWDTVRFSDPADVKHRVVTFFPDGYFGAFVYARPLSELGAYRNQTNGGTGATNQVVGNATAPSDSSAQEPSLSPTLLPALRRLPSSWKAPLARAGNSVLSSNRRSAMRLYGPATRRILSELLRFRPDVIHVHGFYGFRYGVYFKKLFRCRLVHTVPALYSQMSEQGTGWLMTLYRRYHRLVDCFFVAEGYRSELREVGVPDEKLIGLVGTVDLEAVDAFKAESARHRSEVRAALGLPEDSLIAVSVGRLHPSKGHQFALEALPAMVEEFPNLHWLVLGEGDERPQLEARINELGLAEHAHLIGFVSEPLLFYAAADVYLRTFILESENISSFQAVAMGLPTVGFDTHRETDLIAKLGHGLLVPNKDVAALAAAVSRILSMPDRGRQMASGAREYCHQHLDVRKHVRTFTSVYSALREGNKPNFMERTTMNA
jgi:L-malate glycosyltransferase